LSSSRFSGLYGVETVAHNYFAAENRAQELLRSWLSLGQREQYDARGFFEVVGSDTRKRYRIYRGHVFNIRRWTHTARRPSHGASRCTDSRPATSIWRRRSRWRRLRGRHWRSQTEAANPLGAKPSDRNHRGCRKHPFLAARPFSKAPTYRDYREDSPRHDDPWERATSAERPHRPTDQRSRGVAVEADTAVRDAQRERLFAEVEQSIAALLRAAERTPGKPR
jgi:hypothetical protein